MICFLQDEKGDKELFSVYVPTNHIYVGDIFLLEKGDIIRPNLSVREGLGQSRLCMLEYQVGLIHALLSNYFNTIGNH